MKKLYLLEIVLMLALYSSLILLSGISTGCVEEDEAREDPVIVIKHYILPAGDRPSEIKAKCEAVSGAIWTPAASYDESNLDGGYGERNGEGDARNGGTDSGNDTENDSDGSSDGNGGVDELINQDTFCDLNGNYYPRSYTIKTIEDVEFIAQYACIQGHLYIEEAEFETFQLPNLTGVAFDLGIFANVSLTNLDGLSNLTSIGSSMFIYSNDALADLGGLGNLTDVGGNIEIYENGVLSSCEICDLLDQLVDFNEDIAVRKNKADACWIAEYAGGDEELTCP